MTALLLLKRFWFAIPIALLLVALMLTRGTLASEKKAHSATKTAYAQFQADVKAKTELARLQDAANKARVERDQETVSRETVSEYQNELSALRARYDALRVRLAAKANPGSGGKQAVPSLPSGAGRTDGPAVEAGLPPEDALIASEQALRLQALQEWVRGQTGVER